MLPRQRFVDQGYVSGETLDASADRGEDLIGPAPADHSPQSRLPDGITHDQFKVNQESSSATCPAGHVSRGHSQAADGSQPFKFDPAVCAACPLRAVLYRPGRTNDHLRATLQGAPGGARASADG